MLVVQRTAVAKEDVLKPIVTKKSEETSPKESLDDEVTDTEASDSNKPTAATAAVDKKLPPCPYGKKCYR